MKLKTYLLNRAESTAAWIGFVGMILEFVLHLGNVSTLMLVLFALLIILPEATIKSWFEGWTTKIKDIN